MPTENKTLPATDTLDVLSNHFDEILKTLTNFRGQLTSLQTQIKTAEKATKKHVKQLQKELHKRKKKGNRKPSGFARPTKISTKLCTFMDKPVGTEIARTEVTQNLISYIKKNNLQQVKNKRLINPDIKLKTLLGLSEKDELNYFNLQSYMNQHFIKE